MRGFLINIEMLVAVAIFSVFFYAYVAGFIISESSIYSASSALSGREVAEAQVQAAIAGLYGSGLNLSEYASALNSTIDYGHVILPFGYDGKRWVASGYDIFYRTLPIGGKLYYLEVYANETAN